MLTIKKRSGREEEFSKGKLENSIRWAGASDELAQEIVSKLIPQQGMDTSELRAQVLTALKAKDAAAAQRYERTRTCRARVAPDVSKEMVRLHPDTLRSLGLEAGAPLRLAYAGHTYNVRAEAAPEVALDGARLHAETLKSLGASVEARIALSRA